ncbi:MULTISPECIES: Crp/Fnr family transcriptional regulator [Achromobacter]|uniref:Crp/Fnr family transcriptional regulator n=1 Tax=Achromobacter TaxID=222 RepID=UPI0014021694|nr:MULTISPECIES: Crp/Fnr family transcriptional regulator [Achromobacter]MBC9908624.1 Crp/Fnr family transcriptional regulator [Achromobacter xylosoxidans]MBD0872635.1 Crp/Fnr family transcriptional regulator [Achromobacter xylosoxidans]MDH1299325.1 Crp/Fnr family transcriptional regulator [Achromobacter sp. GD03932]QNP87072.1 Crp/Fnr family transcriptional regulator [Achromobacter xylosoxidans]
MTIVNSRSALLIAALRQHPWFDGVDDAALLALAGGSRWLEFNAGDTIFSEGQAASSCLLVCAGSLQGVRYTADGGDKVFGHVGPGGWLSVSTLFEATPRHLHGVRARTEGNGCLLNAAAFRQLCLNDARFACRVMAHCANLIRHHTDQIDWLTSSSAEERLAEYILRAGKPQDNRPVVLPLSHSQIAVKLGMRAETLSRIFSKWRRQGYISDRRGELCILQLDSLKQLVQL